MRKPLFALAPLALFALFAAVLPFLGSAAPAPSPVGPGGIHALHVDLFRAMDARDGAKIDELLGGRERGLLLSDGEWGSKGDDFLLFLRGPGGAPIDAESPEEARKLLISQDGEDGSTPWKTRILDGWMDCPSGDVSYATLRFERSREVDGKAEVRRYRSTSLASYADGKWRLWHFHLSPAGR